MLGRSVKAGLHKIPLLSSATGLFFLGTAVASEGRCRETLGAEERTEREGKNATLGLPETNQRLRAPKP